MNSRSQHGQKELQTDPDPEPESEGLSVEKKKTQKRRRSRLKNTCGQSDTGETHEADEGADEAAREQTGGPERRIQGNTLDPYRSSLSGPVATL